MTLREAFEIENEVVEEGIKEKVMGAIGGVGMALCLATAAGIPQKAIMENDVKQIVKTMSPDERERYTYLYKMDEENGTNRSGAFMLNYIENEVENGTSNKMMNSIYTRIHGNKPQAKKNFNY